MALSLNQFASLMADQAELAATAMAIQLGAVKPYLSKSDAYRIYSRTNVDRWLKEGLITPIKDGPASAKYRLDRLKIQAVAKISNRPSYKAFLEELT